MDFFNFFQGEKIGESTEIEISGKALIKHRVDIHKLLLKNGTKGVGLNIVTKGFFVIFIYTSQSSRIKNYGYVNSFRWQARSCKL